jgi:hypothetical protein
MLHREFSGTEVPFIISVFSFMTACEGDTITGVLNSCIPSNAPRLAALNETEGTNKGSSLNNDKSERILDRSGGSATLVLGAWGGGTADCLIREAP